MLQVLVLIVLAALGSSCEKYPSATPIARTSGGMVHAGMVGVGSNLLVASRGSVEVFDTVEREWLGVIPFPFSYRIGAGSGCACVMDEWGRLLVLKGGDVLGEFETGLEEALWIGDVGESSVVVELPERTVRYDWRSRAVLNLDEERSSASKTHERLEGLRVVSPSGSFSAIATYPVIGIQNLESGDWTCRESVRGDWPIRSIVWVGEEAYFLSARGHLFLLSP